MNRRLFAVLVAFFIASSTCMRNSWAADDDDDDKPKGKLSPVQLSPKALEAADLGIQSLGPGIIDRRLEVPGEILLNSDRLAHLTSKISGVTLHVSKAAGEKVVEGDVLAVIESADLGNAKIEFYSARFNLDLADADLQRDRLLHDNTTKLLEVLTGNPEPSEAESQVIQIGIGEIKTKLLSAYSSLWLAKSSWTRAQKLKEDTLISTAAYDTARKEFEAAKAEYQGTFEEISLSQKTRLLQAERALRVTENAHQNAIRRLRILGLNDAQVAALPKEKEDQINRFELKAPFTGTILERRVGVGEHVNESKETFVIGDLSTVWLNLRIYTKDLDQVAVGQIVKVSVPGRAKSLSGEIASISPVIDSRTRTAQARAVLDNASGQLRPGLFIIGTIVLERTTVPLAVPVEAIQTLAGQNVIFVAGDKEGEFVPKPVTLGTTDGSRIEIKGGVEAGTKAVVKNAFLLKAELGKGAPDND